MSEENDPNVMYGGDIDDLSERPYVSLGDMMLADLRRGGDKPAFINGLTNQTWTYRETLDNSIAMARTLHGAGLKRNDVIVILSENRYEFATISFGAMFLNVIVNPVNVTYTGRELTHVFNLTKPKMVIVSAYAEKRIVEACKEFDFVKKVILLDGETIDDYAVSLKDLIKKHESAEFDIEKQVAQPIDMRDQVAVIMCSSGTTGLPKGVQNTQMNIKSATDCYRELVEIIKSICGVPALKVLNIAPFFHAFGYMTMCLFAFNHDPINVLLPRFEEKAYLEAVQNHKINMTLIVPTIAVMLAKSSLVPKYDISSIKEIVCSGATLSKEVEEKFRAIFKSKVNLRNAYGLTETTFGMITTSVLGKPGSVGEAVFTAYVKVIDENGKSLGPHERGELCFKSDRIMKGYVDNPEATAEIIDKDGWLHSGDIGYYDEDKQFFVVDRIKDLIKYKAFQVPPGEIEALLLTHEKVRDVSVIGLSDEEAGELPLAFVVKQPGVELTEKEVYDFVAENASKAKWLRGGVRFIDELPMNINGKVLKRVLRDMVQAK